MKLVWIIVLSILASNPLTITLIGVQQTTSNNLQVAFTLSDPRILTLQPEHLEAWVDDQSVTVSAITPIVTTPASPTLTIANGSLQAKSMSIGIVIDLSTLLNPDEAQALARQWLEIGRAATSDRIAVFIPPASTSEFRTNSAFTTDRNQVLNDLEGLTPIPGATQLNATIQHAIEATEIDASQHDGLGYVLVISDGGDSAPEPVLSTHKLPVIILPIGEATQRHRYASKLQTLASSTNGHYLPNPDHITIRSAYYEVAASAQVHGFSINLSNLPQGGRLRLQVQINAQNPVTLEIALNPPQPSPSIWRRLWRYWLIVLPGMGLFALWGAKGGRR